MLPTLLSNLPIKGMTAFLNPSEGSYARLGGHKAPKYISWSTENRSQLIRIPAAEGEYRRMELRSPDPGANPYLAFALMIYAGLEGIEKGLELTAPADINFYKADPQTLNKFDKLPDSFKEACSEAASSSFIKKYIPSRILDIYSAG